MIINIDMFMKIIARPFPSLYYDYLTNKKHYIKQADYDSILDTPLSRLKGGLKMA